MVPVLTSCDGISIVLRALLVVVVDDVISKSDAGTYLGPKSIVFVQEEDELDRCKETVGADLTPEVERVLLFEGCVVVSQRSRDSIQLRTSRLTLGSSTSHSSNAEIGARKIIAFTVKRKERKPP